jgi:hypothetical protein
MLMPALILKILLTLVLLQVFQVPVKLIRNRVISIPAPRITAQDAPHGQIKPLHWPVFLQCLNSITGTSRAIATRWRCERRYTFLIEIDRKQQYPHHYLAHPSQQQFEGKKYVSKVFHGCFT